MVFLVEFSLLYCSFVYGFYASVLQSRVETATRSETGMLTAEMLLPFYSSFSRGR